MVFAGFFISSARYVSITVESTPPPDAVFVTGNFDVSGATLTYKDQLVVVPTDIEFKTDGTKLFVAIQGSLSIYEYSMSNAWDLTTVSADATTSLSVSNMSQVQTIDFNRDGTKLYACGSGNVAEFSLSSGYDLSTAGSQSTLDISVYTGPNILGACFSNSVSNNYLHFTSTGSTGFGADPLIRLTFDNTTYGDAPRDINPYGSDPTGITFTQSTDVVRFGTGAGDYNGTAISQFNHLDEFNQWGITLAAWVYMQYDSGSPYKTIVSHSGYTNTPSTGWRFYLYQQTSTTHYMLLYYGSHYIRTAEVSIINQWTHVAVTIASNGSDVTFYMNGVLEPVANDQWFSPSVPSGVTSTLDLMSDPVGTYEAERYMDDFCYFTRVLTAEQVFSLYASYVSTPHYISTIEIEDPLSGSTFLGASANVVPLINSVVAHDLHTTRTLEVSGGGSRFYQIYRNTDLSNVYVVEFKLGTPHDASTLTSVTQIEDYFNIATQSGGTALYDTFNSLKIKPDGTEMFLSGTYYYDANNNLTTATVTGEWGTHYFSRNIRYTVVNNWTYATYGRIRIYEYDSSAGTVQLIHTIDGTSTNDLSTNHTILITESATTYFNIKRGAAGYVTVNDYDGSSWSTTQTLTITPYGFNAGAALSYNEDILFVSLSGYTSPVGSVGVWTKSGGTWSLSQVIRNPYTSSDSNFRSISVSSDNSTLLLGDPLSNYNSTDNGIVFVYSNVAGTWTYTNQTLDNPYSGFTQFAFEDSSLDINSDGTRAFVGSHYYNSQQGAVYIYDYNGSTWSLSQAIVGPVGTTNFGLRVSCSSDGKRICVGTWVASGALVHIYDYDDTTWSLSQSLTPVIGGARFFGYYCRIAPDKSIIGVSEMTTTPGYFHYYTTPKTTQTYSLAVPPPGLHITGNQDDVYDIWDGTDNVTATGSGVFSTTNSITKTHINALTFDNTTATDFTVPNFASMNTLPLTVSGWFHKTNTQTNDVILSSGNYSTGTSQGWALFTRGTNGEYLSVWSTGSSYTDTNVQTPNYQWNHFVIVIDSGSCTFYINGELTGKTTTTYNLTSSNYLTGQSLVVGNDLSYNTYFFGGYMNDIRVHSGIIPEKTAKKMYLDGLAPSKDPVVSIDFETTSGFNTTSSNALAFHYGDFDDAYGDGTVSVAASRGRVYADTPTGTYSWGTLGSASTASGQTTYTWTPPSDLTTEVLLVAGGGGGGGTIGGGGGAGGVVFYPSTTISGQKTIVVGNGGLGGLGWPNDPQAGARGSDTTFTDLTTAVGGGAGGALVAYYETLSERNGGSGGGGGSSTNSTNRIGGTGTSGQGFNGGNGENSNNRSGGGGGAGGVGGSSTGNGGAGGIGKNYSQYFSVIYGDKGWFASGGGGGVRTGYGSGGIASPGGGTDGTNATVAADDAQAHTGGGGGGGGFNIDTTNRIGGDGGSGIVLINMNSVFSTANTYEVGGTSLATLQSNTLTYQGNYVGDVTDSNSNVQITNWTTFYAPFTFSMWLYLIPNNQSYKVFFVTSGYWTASKGFWYSLGYNNNTQPYEVGAFIRTDTGLTLQEFSSAVHYLDYRWSHHTLSWDGSKVRIYVDGQLTHSGTDTESMGAIGQDITLFQFRSDAGAGSPQGGHILDGYVDDIRIYDYVLDPKEVEYLYTSTVVHKDQTFYLSYDQSNVYDYYAGTTDVTATGTGVFYQNPGSKIGTHSGQYPQGSTGTLVPVWSGLNAATSLTISFWIWFDADTTKTQDPFVSEDYFSTSSSYAMQVTWGTYPAGTISIYVRYSSTSRVIHHAISNLGVIAKNKWAHLVTVFDPQVSPYAFLYVNGVKQTITSSSGTMTFAPPAGKGFRIGGTDPYTLEAVIDDLRVFTRALPGGEVAALYREYTQSRIYTLNVPNLIAYTEGDTYVDTSTFSTDADKKAASTFNISNLDTLLDLDWTLEFNVRNLTGTEFRFGFGLSPDTPNRNPVNTELRMYIYNWGATNAYFYNDYNSITASTSTFNMTGYNRSDWITVKVEFDNDPSGDQFKYYLNGNLVGSISTTWNAHNGLTNIGFGYNNFDRAGFNDWLKDFELKNPKFNGNLLS